jgi:hypothetical protein
MQRRQQLGCKIEKVISADIRRIPVGFEATIARLTGLGNDKSLRARGTSPALNLCSATIRRPRPSLCTARTVRKIGKGRPL